MVKKEPRKGRQTSAKSIILPYTEIRGQETVDLYTASGRSAQEWQGLLTYDLLAVNKDGPWYIPNSFFWFSDGTEKEVVLIRELYGLDRGEHILHTAHRTTTSTSASRRFFDRLMAVGYEEVIRVKRGEKYDMAMCFGRNFG